MLSNPYRSGWQNRRVARHACCAHHEKTALPSRVPLVELLAFSPASMNGNGRWRLLTSLRTPLMGLGHCFGRACWVCSQVTQPRARQRVGGLIAWQMQPKTAKSCLRIREMKGSSTNVTPYSWWLRDVVRSVNACCCRRRSDVEHVRGGHSELLQAREAEEARLAGRGAHGPAASSIAICQPGAFPEAPSAFRHRCHRHGNGLALATRPTDASLWISGRVDASRALRA